MASTNLNIRTDKAVKDQADAIFSELGLTMTTAVNLFLRAAVREHGIPFSLKLDEPNDETKAALAEYEEMKNNPENYKRYDSFAALTKDVLNDA